MDERNARSMALLECFLLDHVEAGTPAEACLRELRRMASNQGNTNAPM